MQSGLWNGLFREREDPIDPDWTSVLVDQVTDLGNQIIEIPSAVLAFMASAVLLLCDFVSTQVQAVAEILRLEDWWGIEHTVFCLFMAVNVYIVLRRKRGDWFNQLCQINCFLKSLATVGCFLWLAAGLQGGVVFGGKLIFPSLALLSTGIQIVRVVQHIFHKEIYGYGENEEATEEVDVKKVRSFLGRSLCLLMSSSFIFATFGLPKLNEEDLWPWISLFPLIAHVHLTKTYFHPEVQAINGNVTKTLENEQVPKKSDPRLRPRISRSKTTRNPSTSNDEEKKVAAKGDISQRPAENKDKQTAVVYKAACRTAVSLRIDSPLWDFIISTVTTIGTALALAFAYWTLTEDYSVLVMPVVCRLVSFLAGKAKDRNWLSERGHQAAVEVGTLLAAATQYYLFRTYIALPPAGLQTLTETQVGRSLIPISARDGRNGAIVLVSAISLLTGVAPVTF